MFHKPCVSIELLFIYILKQVVQIMLYLQYDLNLCRNYENAC